MAAINKGLHGMSQFLNKIWRVDDFCSTFLNVSEQYM